MSQGAGRTFLVASIAVLAVPISIAAYSWAQSDSGGPRSEGEWLGFVYPNPNNLLRHEVVGSFGSLNECLAAVRAETASSGRHRGGTYECSLNCRDDGTLPMVCERTIGNER